MRLFKADLHIHTVLSPCTELSMGPRDIVEAAVDRQLDIIAITDHNSAENVDAVMKAAKDTQLTVIPGMEVYTREEAHVLCLFPDLARALELQQEIYAHLPEGVNDASFFGEQFICDEHEHIIDECERLLCMPTDLSLNSVAEQVDALGGILIPAHVDRPCYSILSTLGFVPKNLSIHAIELTMNDPHSPTSQRFLNNSKFTVIASSDAHDLRHLGSRYTVFKMHEPTFDELALCMQKKDGREVYVNVEP